MTKKSLRSPTLNGWNGAGAPGSPEKDWLKACPCRRRTHEQPDEFRNCLSERTRPDRYIQPERIRNSVEIRCPRVPLQYTRRELASIQRRHRQIPETVRAELGLVATPSSTARQIQ